MITGTVTTNNQYIIQGEIVDALKAQIKTLKLNVPVYDEWPSDSQLVRFGLYVSDLSIGDRSPYQLALSLGGNIYIATDEFTVTYVSFQKDPNKAPIRRLVDDLVTYEVPKTGLEMMNGYFERDYVQALDYGPQLQKYTWTFRLKRLEFQ